ncbi:DUF4232 domain-containing protein [Streptomyces sp. NPDC048650]|uniref:DUF4232 domain-containing protein n=1 Tax=unclassified Streptomyces TaxID=2593676 RepID=UPI0037142135
MPRSDAVLRPRTARRRTLRATAAGMTAAAALTLVGCGSQDDADALRTRPAKPFRPVSLVAEGTVAGHGGSGAPRESRARYAACDASRLRIVAKPPTRSRHRLLLVATNTSGAVCGLYAAPHLRFDDARAALAGLPGSRPRAMVALAPGASGYAAVLTSTADGAGSDGRTAVALRVRVAGRDGRGATGGTAQVPLPTGPVRLDGSARVTYWQPDPGGAAAW